MNPATRPLAGLVVNLSVSESDDSTSRGFPSWQVNRVTLQIVAALFGQGASVAFGHDWREDGVMEAVHGFALEAQQPPVPLSPDAVGAHAHPLLRNILPWPDIPRLSEMEQEQLRSTLRVEQAGLPQELEQFEAEARAAGPNSPLYVYLRSRGLTFLRHKLNDVSHVRFCLGGRRSGSQGRYPGVIEEALLAVQDNKPLYLASILGGASEQVGEAIEGKVMPDDFCVAAPIERIYQQPPVTENNADTASDRSIDRNAVWREFSEAGRERIAETNALSIGENDELFRTTVVERAIELVLTGLSRIRPT
jgi:SLOG-like protein